MHQRLPLTIDCMSSHRNKEIVYMSFTNMRTGLLSFSFQIFSYPICMSVCIQVIYIAVNK
jgi:hypothetical protein